jgi:outer membrane protein TolC
MPTTAANAAPAATSSITKTTRTVLVREARRALERAEDDVKRSRERLKNLINNPPPGKKRPKKDVS